MRWIVALILLAGCNNYPTGVVRVKQRNNYSILKIDGCEYIECDYDFGQSRVYSLTHKGNCSNPIHPYNPEHQP